jgi:DNA-binding GntR family transcriptional regulator
MDDLYRILYKICKLRIRDSSAKLDDRNESHWQSMAAPTESRKIPGPRTRAEAAAEELRRRILEGAFPGGFQLRQDALAEEFGVSRIPIREALVQLEAEGLVKIHPHRGAIVSELSIGEIEELVELRVLLEPRLLKRSAPHLTDEDYQALNAILSEYSAELRANNVGRWGALNVDLHALLYRHAGLPRTAAIVASLLKNNDRYTRMQMSLTGGSKRAEQEHRAMVQLCRKGEIAAACKLLAEHIKDAGDQLVAYLEQQAEPAPAGLKKAAGAGS